MLPRRIDGGGISKFTFFSAVPFPWAVGGGSQKDNDFWVMNDRRKKTIPAPATRPPIRRVQCIHDRIASGGFPNATSLARDLEVSARTVLRDIDFMRYALKAPIAFNPRENGYYYTEKSFVVPSARMSRSDFAALLVAERAARALGPSPIGDVLASVRDRLAMLLPEEVRLDPAEQTALMNYRVAAPVAPPERFLETLASAIVERTTVSIQYRSATRGGARSSRRIDPYAMVTQDGTAYLLAYCHQRRKILTFAIHRIDNITETNEQFIRDPDFSLSRHFEGAFRIFEGKRPVKLRVLFSKKVSYYLRERQWHPTQTLRDGLDGSVEATFRATHLDEMLRFVLGWGADAEVLAPPAARRRAAELIAAMGEKYRSGRSPR